MSISARSYFVFILHALLRSYSDRVLFAAHTSWTTLPVAR